MVRQELIELIDRCGGDAGQHVGQVIERIDIVPLAGGNQAEQDRCGSAAIVAATEQPVLASQGDAADGVLRSVVVDVQVNRPIA